VKCELTLLLSAFAIAWWPVFDGIFQTADSVSSKSIYSLQQGKEFLDTRLPAWRAFGRKPIWCKYFSKTKDYSLVWHAKPGFALQTCTFAIGDEEIRICNNRYSANIKKKSEATGYELVHIGSAFDVSAANMRTFDTFSYTMDKEYLPDLIENNLVEVTSFEQVGHLTKVGLKYTDPSRTGILGTLNVNGNFQLTFDESPYPIAAVFTSGGKFPQIHRMCSERFQTVGKVRLPVHKSYVTEQYDETGTLIRTMTITGPALESDTFLVTKETLDSRLCFLEYYGLSEPRFSESRSSWLSGWVIGILFAGLLIAGVIVWRRC